MKPNKKQRVTTNIDSDEEMQNLDQVKKIRRLAEDSNDIHFNRISNDSQQSPGSQDFSPTKS